MRRRDFIKGIGGTAAGWRTRTLLGAAALQAPTKLMLASPAAAQATISLPIEIVPQIGHSDYVTSVAFSPNGHTIASGSDDRTVKLWDAQSGRELRTLMGHAYGPRSVSGAVWGVAFSPDGRRIVSASGDKSLKLWDTATGGELRTLAGHDAAVLAVAFSPDGRSIASGSVDGTLKVWDAASGRALRTLVRHGSSVRAVAFSPDGRTIVSASDDKTLKIWDAASGPALRTLARHSDAVTAVAFSLDGGTIVSGSRDKTLKVWEPASGRELRTLEGHSSEVSGVAFSPDGRTIVSASYDKTLKLWNAARGNALRTLSGHTDRVFAVAFSPDGRTIVSGSYDETLKVWDAVSGRALRTLARRSDVVTAVAFSPDGRTIVSGSTNRSPKRWTFVELPGATPLPDSSTLKLWDAASGRELHTFAGHGSWVSAVVFSPDGRTFVSVSDDKTLKLWDAASGRDLRTLAGHSDDVKAVAFSPDGRTIVSGSDDETLKVWDVASGRALRTLVGHDSAVQAVVFSPDGRSIISGGKDLKVWDTTSGRVLSTLAGNDSWAYPVAFSPDRRRIVSASSDNSLKLWDTATGGVLRTLVGHDAAVLAVAFSSDGRTIVSASYDKTLKLWDAASGNELRTLSGHGDRVFAVALSPDGRAIVSGSRDATIRRWNLAGELLTTSISTSGGEWLTITPEGFFTASDKGADLLGAVRGLENYSIDQFYQQLYRPDVVRQKLSFNSDRVKYAADKVNLGTILASKAPPVITIVSPGEKSEVGSNGITVEAKLAHRETDNNGGVGRVEWRVNGVTRAVEDFQLPAGVREKTIARQLALPPGDNVIELVAYNKANLVASLPAAVSVSVKPVATHPKPMLHVLAIGVDKYPKPQIDDLRYSVGDAKAVLAAFELFKSDKKTYADVVTHGLFDEQVTAQNVRAEFKRLGTIIRPNDVFVLYLAGHGITLDGRFYFVPHNAEGTLADLNVASAIGQNQLQDWLTEVPAFRSVLIYDSCESGSATEDRSGFRGLQQLVAAEKLSRSMGRTVLSATTDVTAALEGYEKHGVFTYVLLDAFAHADRDNDGQITTEELAEYLRAKLPALTEDLVKKYPDLKLFRQEPQVKLSGAPFALIPRANIADINRLR